MWSVPPLPTVAASPDSIQPIDTSKKVTLTLQYLYNEQPIDGAEFRLYRVGDVTRAGAFKVNSPFYEVYDPNDEWKDVVSKMLQQVKVREVDPVRVKNTDSNGVAVFQSEENSPLKTGLYLVESIPLELENEDAYIATSFLVMLPSFVGSNHDGVQQVWNYDVIAAPKAKYSGNNYKVYFWDNRAKINNATVTGMPQDITFKRDSESLIYRENPLDAYVRRISGAGNEKNSYSIPYAEPEAEGYKGI